MEKDNTLRHLNRAQLLDMLYDVVQEKEMLEKQVQDLEQQLSDREIKVQEAGNLAKAALKLNGVFEQAQAAADQYEWNIRRAADAEAEAILKQAEADAEEIRNKARTEAEEIRNKAKRKAEEIREHNETSAEQRG